MMRLYAALSTMVVSIFLATVLLIVPQVAEAHTSLVPDQLINLTAHAEDEQQSHCHAAVDCVVTLYLEPLPVRTAFGIEPEMPPVGLDKLYRDLSISRDPPVPIFRL